MTPQMRVRLLALASVALVLLGAAAVVVGALLLGGAGWAFLAGGGLSLAGGLLARWPT